MTHEADSAEADSPQPAATGGDPGSGPATPAAAEPAATATTDAGTDAGTAAGTDAGTDGATGRRHPTRPPGPDRPRPTNRGRKTPRREG